jgi:hypothetical protein
VASEFLTIRKATAAQTFSGLGAEHYGIERSSTVTIDHGALRLPGFAYEAGIALGKPALDQIRRHFRLDRVILRHVADENIGIDADHRRFRRIG